MLNFNKDLLNLICPSYPQLQRSQIQIQQERLIHIDLFFVKIEWNLVKKD